MIETLDIVKGSVAKKDLIPILTHFHIYDGRIQGNNGKLCIDAPLDSDLNITVPADKFYKAVKMCGAKLKTKITEKGKLSMTCGKFRAFLNIVPNENFPKLEIKTSKVFECEGIIPLIKELIPFVSDDASRPWAQAILIKDGYAYATNNIIAVRIKVNYEWEGTIPVLTAKEIVRIGKQPSVIAIEDSYVCFKYDNGVWIRGTTVAIPWPDIASFIRPCPTKQLPAYFLDTLHALVPFCDDAKYPFISLDEKGMHTDSDDIGANVDLAVFPKCKFRAEPLISVANIAHSINFGNYPKPCYFVGDNIDGVIVGIL